MTGADCCEVSRDEGGPTIGKQPQDTANREFFSIEDFSLVFRGYDVSKTVLRFELALLSSAQCENMPEGGWLTFDVVVLGWSTR